MEWHSWLPLILSNYSAALQEEPDTWRKEPRAACPRSGEHPERSPRRSGVPAPGCQRGCRAVRRDYLCLASLQSLPPTVCQSQFLTSHLKLDPNFETRSAPAPLGSSGSSSESLPARKGWRDGSQGSQVFGAGTRLAGLSSIHPAAGDCPGSARGAQRRARGRAPPAAPCPRDRARSPAPAHGSAVSPPPGRGTAHLPSAAPRNIEALWKAQEENPSTASAGFPLLPTLSRDICRLFGFVPEEKAELPEKIYQEERVFWRNWLWLFCMPHCMWLFFLIVCDFFSSVHVRICLCRT